MKEICENKHIQARPSGRSNLQVDDNILEAGDLGDSEESCYRRWALHQHSCGLSLRVRLGAQMGRRNRDGGSCTGLATPAKLT